MYLLCWLRNTEYALYTITYSLKQLQPGHISTAHKFRKAFEKIVQGHFSERR